MRIRCPASSVWNAWWTAEFLATRSCCGQIFCLNDPGPRNAGGDYAVFVGRLCVEKGIRQLLWAWRRLRRIPLVIVGDGPLRGEAESYIERNGMEQCALNRGHSPAGNPGVREASALPGVPERGLRDVWDDGARSSGVRRRHRWVRDWVRFRNWWRMEQQGCCFDPHDTDELVEKAEWAWAHPMSINEMGAAARRRYLQHYTAERSYEGLMRIYASVIAKPGVERSGEWA